MSGAQHSARTVDTVRRMYGKGKSLAEVARATGLPIGTVWGYMTGERRSPTGRPRGRPRVEFSADMDAVLLEPISAAAKAARIGVSVSVMYRRMAELGVKGISVPRNAGGRPPIAFSADMDAVLLEPISKAAMAARLGVDVSVVYRRLDELGAPRARREKW